MPIQRSRIVERRDQGFTLVEILVVIIIIGILAAIAIPVFLNQRKKANLATAKQDSRQVATAINEYVGARTNPAIAFCPLGTSCQPGGQALTDIITASPYDVKLSPGNRITDFQVSGYSFAFCIKHFNSDGTFDAAVSWDSNNTGINGTSNDGTEPNVGSGVWNGCTASVNP